MKQSTDEFPVWEKKNAPLEFCFIYFNLGLNVSDHKSYICDSECIKIQLERMPLLE